MQATHCIATPVLVWGRIVNVLVSRRAFVYSSFRFAEMWAGRKIRRRKAESQSQPMRFCPTKAYPRILWKYLLSFANKASFVCKQGFFCLQTRLLLLANKASLQTISLRQEVLSMQLVVPQRFSCFTNLFETLAPCVCHCVLPQSPHSI